MKKLFLIMLFFIAMGITSALPQVFEFGVGLTEAQAANVTLAWDATSTPADQFDGYTLYYKGDVREPEKVSSINLDKTVLEHTLTDLAPGEWTFWITAYSIIGGESESSDVVAHSIQGYVPPVDDPHGTVIIVQPPVTLIIK